MFDRTRVATEPREQGSLSAEVVLADDQVLTGRFVVGSAKPFAEIVNGPGAFLEFEPTGGERQFIAKSQIKSIRLIAAPGAEHLKARLRDLEGFDPHTILGVKPDLPWDEVRQAYIVLSKRYHPDRYANADLPAEVGEYLAAMARRVNAAFTVLDGANQSKRVAAHQRSIPVYESGRPRGV
jgi:DnaJ domain